MGLGFRVWGSGFRVRGSGFSVLRFTLEASGSAEQPWKKATTDEENEKDEEENEKDVQEEEKQWVPLVAPEAVCNKVMLVSAIATLHRKSYQIGNGGNLKVGVGISTLHRKH